MQLCKLILCVGTPMLAVLFLHSCASLHRHLRFKRHLFCCQPQSVPCLFLHVCLISHGMTIILFVCDDYPLWSIPATKTTESLKCSSSSGSSILWKPHSSQAVPVSSSASTGGRQSQLDSRSQLSAKATLCSGASHTAQAKPQHKASQQQGEMRHKACASPRVQEPLWCSFALLFQLFCICKTSLETENEEDSS